MLPREVDLSLNAFSGYASSANGHGHSFAEHREVLLVGLHEHPDARDVGYGDERLQGASTSAPGATFRSTTRPANGDVTERRTPSGKASLVSSLDGRANPAISPSVSPRRRKPRSAALGGSALSEVVALARLEFAHADGLASTSAFARS